MERYSFYFNCEYVLIVNIEKQRKKSHGFYKTNSWILKIFWKSNFVRGFHKKDGVTQDPTTNLCPNGSAVLTFIGYKQTDKHTDRQAKFIYRCM